MNSVRSQAVAKSAGASRVMVVGAPEKRLQMARRFGAGAVLECSGNPAAVPEGMEMCRDGGRYLASGRYCDAGTVALNPHVITRKQLQVADSWSSEPRHLRSALGSVQERDYSGREHARTAVTRPCWERDL